jgi:hypothetical protein
MSFESGGRLFREAITTFSAALFRHEPALVAGSLAASASRTVNVLWP